MELRKPLQFNGTVGGYLIVLFLTMVLLYVPVLGWALLLNYSAGWFAKSSLINGKKVVYRASYGETLKFVVINTVLVVVTFGIYALWFAPKLYRYIADHVEYADAQPLTFADTASLATQPPADPTNPPTTLPPLAS